MSISGFVFADISLGLCAVSCAEAESHVDACRCICRGRNHGALAELTAAALVSMAESRRSR